MNSRLERLRRSLHGVLSDMSNDELSWHPEGKWSVAQVLEHLYLTYTGTIKGLSRVEQAGSPLAGIPSLRHFAQTFVVVGLGYFPAGRKSPRVAEPRGLAREMVINEITAKIDEMEEMITRCERKFGSRKKLLDHPMLGPLSAKQWRKFHCVHGMHHVRQIERLRREMKRETPALKNKRRS